MKLRLGLVKRIGCAGVHDRLILQKVQTGVGYPLTVTKQFYQTNSGRGEQTSLHRVGQLDKLVTPWEFHNMSARGMNKLAGVRKCDVEIEGDWTEAADQLGEYHEVLQHVRVSQRPDRIEDAHQVGFLIRKTEVAVT
jgi:hypothetical protein